MGREALVSLPPSSDGSPGSPLSAGTAKAGRAFSLPRWFPLTPGSGRCAPYCLVRMRVPALYSLFSDTMLTGTGLLLKR